MATKAEQVHWGTEPQWDEFSKDPIEQACALARAENWYHHMSDDADHRKWILEFMKDNNFKESDIKAVARTNRTVTAPGEVAPTEPGCNAGVLARLLTKGAPLPPVRKERLLKAIRHLAEAGKNIREEEKVEGLPNIQDRIREQVSNLIGELEQLEDAFLTTKGADSKNGCNSIADYISKKNIRGIQATRIAEWFRRRLEPIDTLLGGKADDQLKEAYSLYSKKQLKEYHKWLNCLIVACQHQVEISKKLRSPRRRKPRDPSKVVRNLKFKKEDAEWKIKSVHPTKIIGAEKVILFNVKKKTCTILEASTRNGLSVKGTTIIDFDADKSKSKRLRKPEPLLKAIREDGGIRSVKNAFGLSNTVEKEAKGRVNSDTVILATY